MIVNLLNLPEVLVRAVVLLLRGPVRVVVHEAVDVLLDAELVQGAQGLMVDHGRLVVLGRVLFCLVGTLNYLLRRYRFSNVPRGRNDRPDSLKKEATCLGVTCRNMVR